MCYEWLPHRSLWQMPRAGSKCKVMLPISIIVDFSLQASSPFPTPASSSRFLNSHNKNSWHFFDGSQSSSSARRLPHLLMQNSMQQRYPYPAELADHAQILRVSHSDEHYAVGHNGIATFHEMYAFPTALQFPSAADAGHLTPGIQASYPASASCTLQFLPRSAELASKAPL